MTLNLNQMQTKLLSQITEANGKEVAVFVGGSLSQHKNLTKEKTAEEAAKETADKKLNFSVQPGYSFSIKDPKLLSGEGALKDYIGSRVKDGYLGIKPQKFMPTLLYKDGETLTDISEEFKGLPLSYNGEVQVKFVAREYKGRVYVNCQAVLFLQKPDIFNERKWQPNWYDGTVQSSTPTPTPTTIPQPAEVAAPVATPSPW